MIKRTYSRRNLRPLSEDPPPSKRRRVETPPPKDLPLSDIPNAIAASSSSSPTPNRDSILSDEPSSNTTPPSSPPPLRDITEIPQRKPKTKPTKLTQLTLDLGQTTRKKCPHCGMTYTPSNPVDNLFHKKFHAQSIGGVDLSRRFIETVSKEDSVWSDTGGDFIVALDRSAGISKRKVVEVVVDVVERELGGVGVDGLWGAAGKEGESLADGPGDKRGEDRYKAFLYIRSHKCIGFLLAERISSAFPVVPSSAILNPSQITSENDSSSITVSPVSSKAIMGISRIWTSSSTRRSGVAATLLDCARENFLYGMKVSKENVAFSQPTDSGARLARRWFDKGDGWLVYSL